LVPFGQVVSEEKIKPEALKSLYRSPGNNKKQLVLKKSSPLKQLGQMEPNLA
jgi:hypothetical protein